MKFFLEFVACGGSSRSSENRRTEEEETGLMVVQEEPRRITGRKQGSGRAGGQREWRPSLSSISEDGSTEERINSVDKTAAGWRGTLKRKVSSASQRDRSTRCLDHDDGRRRAPLPPFMPQFSPTPFMF